MGTLHLVNMPLQIASDKQAACAVFGAVDVAICQNMIRSGAKNDPDRFYRLQHLWATKWKAAGPTSREFFAVDSAAAKKTQKEAMEVDGINKLAAIMTAKFRIVCEKACGATVYMALGHGGAEMLDEEMKKLPERRTKLQEEREELRKHKEETDRLGRKHADYASRREYEKKRRAELDSEDALVNRSDFPSFSLGSQKGGLHAQYLAMSYDYFVFVDYPNGGWSPEQIGAYEARRNYFAALKAIFNENKIKTLHLVACNIGKDSVFIRRVGQELGVDIVSYAYFVGITEVTGFMGLSTDKKKNDVVAATSVDPPRAPVVVS